MSRPLIFASILAGSLFAYTAAVAQSTATQAQELVVTGKREARSTGGLAVQVREAKDVSVITQTFIQHQTGSENFAQLINMLPGVSYSSEDYTGVLSGDFRMHGLDGAHVSVTIDGSPVNDTGNYAIYPGEYLTSEVTDHITVNMGATSVDSPTASAIGGTIDIVSKKPTTSPQTTVKLAGGSYDYLRAYAEQDSGVFGPTGASSYLSVNYTDANKWKGKGDINRLGFDGKVYQPLWGKDFMSLAFTYANDEPIFYYSGSRAQLAQYGRNFDYNTTWIAPTVTPGKADTVPSSAGPAGSDTNYYKLHPNPVIFADVRGQSLFDLGHGFTLTVDPSYFYTLANGGGATGISECDLRLKGASGTCVDLNGDGDTLDTVPVYTPNTTQTDRIVLTSSLLWDMDEHNHFQLAYTFDHGRHRQTGQYTPINLQTGAPDNVFGAVNGYGVPILTSDGALLRGRDRFSIAMLNQVSLNYIGKFLDDRLHVNLGVRDPHFQRDLNQYCDTYNGASYYCTTASQSAILAAYNADVGTGKTTHISAYVPGVKYDVATGAPNFRFPFKQTYKFDKALPNAGLTYDFDDHSQVYATYAQGFSAPKTDDLYTSETELVKPETSDEYGVGYRYQSPKLTVSANLWDTEYKNRIVQSTDPNDPSLSIDRNVGDVQIYGLDFEAGWRPIEHLSLYGSATFEDSRLESNYFVTNSSGVTLAVPTKGKQLVLTPKEEFAGRAQYDWGDFTIGADVKYTGKRYISDVNDDSIGAFTTVDLDAKYVLPILHRATSVAINVQNLFGENYFSRASTVANSYNVTGPTGAIYSPSTPFLYVGAPTTVVVTLQAVF